MLQVLCFASLDGVVKVRTECDIFGIAKTTHAAKVATKLEGESATEAGKRVKCKHN